MRFDELSIQTQREAPSNSRTEGFAFLVRAGYLTREGRPLEMARRVSANARSLYDRLPATAGTPAEMSRAFFSRVGLGVVAAHTSDEFYFPISTGADEMLACAVCGYAARRELAGLRKPVPGSEAALPAEKVATPECSTIETLANYLHIPKEKTAKAVMFVRISDGRFVFSIVRGDMQLSEMKLRRLVGGEVRPAAESEILAVGAIPGYASPVGVRDTLVVVDDLLPVSPNLAAGANQAGYHLINVNYPRDFQAELVGDIVQARAGDACPDCGAALALRAAQVVANGGGVDFDGLLLPLAEAHHDEKGLSLPPSIAPFDVHLMNVPGKTLDTAAPAESLYQRLQEAGLSVLFDDRNERAGVKFNDADLIGCPVRLTVGERGLQDGMVELKARKAAAQRLVALSSVIAETRNELTRNG